MDVVIETNPIPTIKGHQTRGILVAATAVVLTGLSSAFALSSSARLNLSDYCNGTDELDDTACIREWIEEGRVSPNKNLYAPAGTYLYRASMPVYSGLDLECAGPELATFRRDSGLGTFISATTPVHGVRIEKCAFDVKGSTANFLAVIDISADAPEPSTNILVRRNRIYDSAITGTTSAQQRQYILLLNCHDCRVVHNHLTEGGRIKLGRPGRQLTIRENTVEHANDNAITVVDIGTGVSEEITIEKNRIVSPKGIGIFFGADGEGQTSSVLTTRAVRIENNHIEGNWGLACILGTLPAIAEEIRVTGNTCVKTGTGGAFQLGIGIKRTNGAQAPGTDVRVERNRVISTVEPASGAPPALDYGGIFFSGSYVGVRVTHNEIRNVGPRAMLFRAVDIDDAKIVRNTMIGGVLVIEGTVQGDVQPHAGAGGEAARSLPSRHVVGDAMAALRVI